MAISEKAMKKAYSYINVAFVKELNTRRIFDAGLRHSWKIVA